MNFGERIMGWVGLGGRLTGGIWGRGRLDIRGVGR